MHTKQYTYFEGNSFYKYWNIKKKEKTLSYNFVYGCWECPVHTYVYMYEDYKSVKVETVCMCTVRLQLHHHHHHHQPNASVIQIDRKVTARKFIHKITLCVLFSDVCGVVSVYIFFYQKRFFNIKNNSKLSCKLFGFLNHNRIMDVNSKRK